MYGKFLSCSFKIKAFLFVAQFADQVAISIEAQILSSFAKIIVGKILTETDL
ncbi:MAG: hypothetical protein LBU14_03090 [Candidatus Peribacteria bacterium]|nr:hypothetical protein [Candidatus Peribacteria bacterium]